MATSLTEIRDLLDGPAATSVPDDTVTVNLERSQNFVNSVAESTATTAAKDDAVSAMAVWLTYGSFMEGITEQLGAISEASETKLNHYRKVAELFLGQVAGYTIDLDNPTKGLEAQATIPIDPSTISMTTSEAYSQN